MFIIILWSSSSKDLVRTRTRCILHIAPVSNKTHSSNRTQMQDSRRIFRHSNRTIKLHDRLHHLQIQFWVRSLSWWSKWTRWTRVWTRYRISSRRTSLPWLIIRRVSKFHFLTNYHCWPLSTLGIKGPHRVKRTIWVMCMLTRRQWKLR